VASSKRKRARPAKKSAEPKRTRRPPDGYVSAAEVVQRLGVSKNLVSYMAREEGAPCDHHGWRWPETMHWFIRREKARGRPAGGGEGASLARDRLETARAEMAELELAKLRGELMTLEQYDTVVGGAFARVRARLLNLPGKFAGEGEMKAREELLELAQRLIDEALEELATGDDVPHALDEAAA
jgi:hypothetical protein